MARGGGNRCTEAAGAPREARCIIIAIVRLAAIAAEGDNSRRPILIAITGKMAYGEMKQSFDI
jgi:hypothetical protein